MNIYEYLEECKTRAFCYGQYDCGIFVAGWLEHLTGIDHAKKLRGKYKTQEQGLNKLKMSLRKYAQKVLQGPYPINLARTGDIALRVINLDEQLKNNKARMMMAEAYGDDEVAEKIKQQLVEDGETVGIVVGRFVYGPTDLGIGRTPLSEWQEVYRA